MKHVTAVLLALVLMLVSAAACAQISVSKKDLSLNQALDKSVTNILVMMQDAEAGDVMMVASINSSTGRAVMTRIDTSRTLDIPEAGMTALCDVYALGDEKSRCLLVARTLNQWLGLNISTYVALDVTRLPELVEAVGTLNMQLTEEEGQAMGTWSGINELSGDAVLSYVRVSLDSDTPARSRGYDALMQLLYQGLHSGNVMGMMGLGSKLLASMDTNLSALQAVTLVSAVQGGTERVELMLSAEMTDEEAAAALQEAVYGA